MKPIIIQNSKIPKMLSIFISIYAITLFPFIISRDEMSEATIRHECIHIEQQRELWVVGFYFLYAWYWLMGKISGKVSKRKKKACLVRPRVIYNCLVKIIVF